MSADCDKWQADSWRRNSQKWGSQGWEGGPPSPASSIPQTPPPIPAPPPDPQDNLTKESTDSGRSNINEDGGNNTTTEKETKYWWEMDDDGDEATEEGTVNKNENKKSEIKEEEENVTDYWLNREDQDDSAPPWRRSRSRTNSPPKMELDAPPTGRRRSRNVMRDLNCPTGDTSRMSTSPPGRRRSRPTTDEPQNFTERSSSSSGRRRRRNDENEVPNGPSQTQESNRSTSPPIRRRTREPSSENAITSQNSTNEEASHPIRRRSRSRALQTDENNGSPNNQDMNGDGNDSAIRRRSRSRALQTEENTGTTPENIQVNSKSPVTRRRSRQTNQQDSHDKEVQNRNSSSPPLRVRVRNPSADTNSASNNVVVEEVVLSLPPRRRRPPALVEGERKGQGDDAQKRIIEPQLAVEMFKENTQELSSEPELCRSTLQVELKTPVDNAQRNSQGSRSEISNKNEPIQVEDSNEGATATVVIRRRPISTISTNEDQTKINFEEKESGDRSRKRSGSCSKAQEHKLKVADLSEEQPPTTVIVRKRPTSSHSTVDDHIRNLSEERNDSAMSGRVDRNSEIKKNKLNEIADQEPVTTTTVRIRSKPSVADTENVELPPNNAVITPAINSVKENEEPFENNGPEEVPSENDLKHRRSVTLSTGSIDKEINEHDAGTNGRRHSNSTSFKDGRDDNTAEYIPINDGRKSENRISLSDNGENDKPKDEDLDWANDQQNTDDNIMDADGWSNCDMEPDAGDNVEHQQIDVLQEATIEMEIEEDDVAKATRIWLESQQALLAPPKPMKIIYLTEEELMFDPLQQAKEEEKVHLNADYDAWDDEPADREPTPEFLKKKLKKVEAQTTLTPLKIDRERSPVSPVFTRRRRGSSPSHDQAYEIELRSSARTRRSRAADGTNHEDKVQENAAPISEVPPPPPPPPPPPASKASKVPPPPPAPPLSKKDKETKKAREEMVEQIKKAARTRPDWHSVMKDIEGGIKLRKVGNDMKADRSMPILPSSRGKGGKFVYESEKPMMHNEMLEAIQRGVRLRHVRTNDRSRPDFNKLGIRKLRRQVTTEEKKTVDPDTPEALPSSSDEEEDIDQMRDDLQSTKTQLSEEIKKTKQIERENKILKIDIESLQAEVKRMKRRLKEAGVNEAKPLANGEADAIAPKLSKSMSKLRMREDDLDFSELDNIEEDIKILNEQIEAQKKRAEQAEQKCEELTQKMKVAENSTDEWELRSIYFEKKFKALQKDQGIELPDINCIGTQTEVVDISAPDSPNALPTKKSLSRKSFGKLNRMESFKEEEEDSEESSSEEEESLSEHIDDDEEDGHNILDTEGEEDDDVRAERQAENESIKRERELKLWQNKIGHAKEKMKNVKRERNNLRDRIKKYYKDMRKEREEYLKVKAELRELAEQMKDEESLVDDSYEETDNSEDDSLSENEGTSKKPKKLKKRKRRKIINEDKQEEILHNDEPDDLCDLVDPEWSASEDSESEQDNEDDDIKTRIKRLKEKLDEHEQLLNEKKKDNYILKSQIDQCDEQYGEERRRNARINTELQLLFADI